MEQALVRALTDDIYESLKSSYELEKEDIEERILSKYEQQFDLHKTNLEESIKILISELKIIENLFNKYEVTPVGIEYIDGAVEEYIDPDHIIEKFTKKLVNDEMETLGYKLPKQRVIERDVIIALGSQQHPQTIKSELIKKYGN